MTRHIPDDFRAWGEVNPTENFLNMRDHHLYRNFPNIHYSKIGDAQGLLKVEVPKSLQSELSP